MELELFHPHFDFIQIEVANGVHPFNDAAGFYGLIKAIVSNDPPKLDSSTFSSEICQFVDKWYIFVLLTNALFSPSACSVNIKSNCLLNP